MPAINSSHALGAGKAATVVAGPTLVTLIPMAAVPSLATMAKRFAGAFGGDGAFLAQLVMTMPAVSLILSAPLIGWLAVRFGRRITLLGALVLFVFAGATPLLPIDAATLMVSRMILGMAGAGMLTVCLALAADFPEGGPRERILGFSVAGASLVAAVTLVGGGHLVDRFGWQAPFALYLFGIPVFVAVWVAVGEPGERKVPGASGSFRGLRPFVRHWMVFACAVVLSIGMFMPSVQGPFLLSARGITSAVTYGAVAAACATVAACASAGFGWVVRIVGVSRMFALIALVFGVGSLMMALSSELSGMVLGSAIMGIAAGWVEATGATLILGRVSEEFRPAAIGTLISSVFLGQFLNPWVVDPLRHAFGIAGAFAAVGAFFCCLALALVVLVQRETAPAWR